jgi:hypothetical protein
MTDRPAAESPPVIQGPPDFAVETHAAIIDKVAAGLDVTFLAAGRLAVSLKLLDRETWGAVCALRGLDHLR